MAGTRVPSRHRLLLGLQHNDSDAVHRQTASCAPGNVKRAEDVVRANVNVPLTIEAIANAADCSVRALQFAFRRFRGATPMAAWQRFRLAAARTEILRGRPTQSLASIAAAYGFSNSGRFTALSPYLRRLSVRRPARTRDHGRWCWPCATRPSFRLSAPAVAGNGPRPRAIGYDFTHLWFAARRSNRHSGITFPQHLSLPPRAPGNRASRP